MILFLIFFSGKFSLHARNYSLIFLITKYFSWCFHFMTFHVLSNNVTDGWGREIRGEIVLCAHTHTRVPSFTWNSAHELPQWTKSFVFFIFFGSQTLFYRYICQIQIISDFLGIFVGKSMTKSFIFLIFKTHLVGVVTWLEKGSSLAS